FLYPTKNTRRTLKKFNLTFGMGQTVGFVGAWGAGKTTMMDLVTRFYDPVSGKILLDGRDLRDFDLGSLHRAMGIVSQSTFLFNDTVWNNIAYACPDATDEAVRDAARRANADGFIQELSEGYDTMLGDRGVRLSGGQQQRLAIARALLRDPDILVLDEATSALDTVSERMVQDALTELSRGRTVLVIAHRLSTVQNADQIVVMDQGEIVEQGTHGELLALNGKYAQLYAMQFTDSQTPTAIHCENVLEQVVLQEAMAQMAWWKSLGGSGQGAQKEIGDVALQSLYYPGDQVLDAGSLQELASRVVATVDVSSVMAYTLNQLPALYATSREGVNFQQQRIDDELRDGIRERVAAAISHHSSNPDFDITRQKLVMEQNGRTVAGVSVLERLSYEVRTHLNVLIGVLTLLSDDLVERGERRDLLQEAYGAAIQILTVSELLRETLKRRELSWRGAALGTILAGDPSPQEVTGQQMQSISRLVDRLTQDLEQLTEQLLDDLLVRSPSQSGRMVNSGLDGIGVSPEMPLFRDIYSNVTVLLSQIEHFEQEAKVA
ncbi:MAG: ATP-binding cassette domain-containing protein, partial [Cyanobacteria bacterium P01_H01_bin.130]